MDSRIAVIVTLFVVVSLCIRGSRGIIGKYTVGDAQDRRDALQDERGRVKNGQTFQDSRDGTEKTFEDFRLRVRKGNVIVYIFAFK